ncbi:SLC13 family permease [Ferrimonas kyonanensis]|uniref:SLC13 family permease n=1 Tax=Ferrimonas kyonanensis TaxID=364763 RepID=UPI0003FBD9A2|nr:SLC13 family permease [Ferrimonas kyonanensis]
MTNWIAATLLALPLWLGMSHATPPLQGMLLFALAMILWSSRLLGELPGIVLIPALALALGLIHPADIADILLSPVLAIFIFGFTFATLSREQQLDRLTLSLLSRYSGHSERRACYLLFAMTALISMWTSNVVTTALMLPLAMSIALTTPSQQQVHKTHYLGIGVAFSATLGGMATQVGSSTSLIASNLSGLDFIGWSTLALPVVVVLWLLMLVTLEIQFRPEFNPNMSLPEATAMTRSQRWTLSIVLVTLIIWVAGAIALRGQTRIYGLVPLIAVLALLAKGLVSPMSVVKSIKWRVVSIFVSAITLGKVLHSSGGGELLMQSVSPQASALPLLAQFALSLAIIAVVTEFMSNVASASLLAPLLALLLLPQGVSQEQVALLVGIGCSFAFVLPSSTPTNSLILASGAVSPSRLMQVGLRYKLVAVCLLLLVLYAVGVRP